MFCPNTTSSGAQPRKPPAASRASAISRSVRRAVSNSPPVFAFDSRR
jgi:hypothetical protein